MSNKESKRKIEKICKYCGKIFTVEDHYQLKKTKFCSEKHREKFFREKMKKNGYFQKYYKKRKEKETLFNIWIPNKIHKKLEELSLKNKKDIKDIIINILEEKLNGSK